MKWNLGNPSLTFRSGDYIQQTLDLEKGVYYISVNGSCRVKVLENVDITKDYLPAVTFYAGDNQTISVSGTSQYATRWSKEEHCMLPEELRKSLSAVFFVWCLERKRHPSSPWKHIAPPILQLIFTMTTEDYFGRK